MIRVVVFLLAVTAAALGVTWLVDRPGDVVIVWPWLDQMWPGHGRIETGVATLIGAIAVVALLAILLMSLLRWLVHSPRAVSGYLHSRRATRGHLAVTRGLVAIGSGDVRAARRFAGEARRLAADEPLVLLLTAQTAQLAGDQAGAERTFRQMAGRDDTKLLGLHGLFVEAQRRDDRTAARAVAEDAVTADPSLAWAAQAVLEFRCADRDWTGALAALDSNMKAALLNKPAYRRQRAVLLAARALSRDGDIDREAAKAATLAAVKLSPGLVPAAALAGRLLAEDGETRKAARTIEAAWRINPHPDLAETYAYLKSGDSARDRLGRVQVLARLAPDHPEGALAIARAAIDAREFAIARTALAPLAAQPTRRVALLMAEIEEGDSGDVGRAREWMGRALHAARDPAWTADGLVSGKWIPVSPVTGRLDAFQWRVPLADLTPAGPMIEERRPAGDRPAEVPLVPAVVERPDMAETHAPVDDIAATADSAPVSPGRARAVPGAARAADPIIPLVHVPDDPGPEPEPEPEPIGAPPPEGWRRLRALFW